VIVGATSQLPGGTCTSTIGNSCSFVALGRDWIEVESQAYHQANEYFIARIPTGAESGSRAEPGGRLAFDLDSSSGVQRLCSPLRYPEAPWTTADGTTAVQPGFMQVLGRFALVADGYVAPTSYRSARLERCGEHSAIQLPTTGIAISSRALAWWATGHVGGILLPSLKRFRLATPSGPINTEWPTMALSASRVYMVNSGKLWAAPLP
jgi:hypothetical protein